MPARLLVTVPLPVPAFLIERRLELPLVRYVGYISYPLYLYHAFGLGIGRRMVILPMYGRFIIGILVSVAIAVASYSLIERPFLKLKRNWGRRRKINTALSETPQRLVSPDA